MTISTTDNKVSYNGNGVTTVFAFPYLFFTNTDLDVYSVSPSGALTLLTPTTDYTVTGAGVESGGTVTTVVPPATGTQLLIVRVLSLTQETDYIEGDAFPAESHERALDRLTMITQQIQEEVDRALTLPVQSSGVSAELPAPVANAFIGWNSAADALQNNAGASSVPVSLAMTPVVAAATLAAGRTAMGVRAAEESSQTTRIDVASAATVNLTTSAPSTRNIRITGTTTITGFTVAAGQTYFVSFSGALTLTNNANIVTNTGANITTAAGDSCIIRATAANTVEVISYEYVTTPVAQGGTGSVTGPILRGHIDGLIMSTAGASTTMTIAAGQATDSTSVALLSLASSLNKTTSAWAVGSGNGGLDTGSIANSTWYYFYLIRRPDTGVVDVVFSLNSTSPTLPTNYTQFRYIGAGLTNDSGQWTRFFQYGDVFRWDTPVQDFNGAGVTTASLLTLSVPRGRKMEVLVTTQGASGGAGGNGVYLSDPDASDLAVTSTGLANAWHTADPGSENMTVQSLCITNTSGQVRRRHWNTATMQITTYGWTDLRGRNA